MFSHVLVFTTLIAIPPKTGPYFRHFLYVHFKAWYFVSSSSQETGEIMVLILQSLCPYSPFRQAGNLSFKKMRNLTKTQRK